MTHEPIDWPESDPPGLVRMLEEQGIRIRTLDGVVLVSDAVAATQLILTYDPLPMLRDTKKAVVKSEVDARILRVAPEWQQRNLLAQATTLLDKGRGQWTPAERAAWDAGRALWDRITALRTASNLIEADIDAMPDWETVNAFDVAASNRWPE